MFLVAERAMRFMDSFLEESTRVISWIKQNRINRHNNAIVFEQGSWVKKKSSKLVRLRVELDVDKKFHFLLHLQLAGRGV